MRQHKGGGPGPAALVLVGQAGACPSIVWELTLNLTDNVKLAAMTLLITLALLFSTLSVGVKVPAFQPSAQQAHSLAEGGTCRRKPGGPRRQRQ